jgi:N-acetylmuramate 1-kinase
VSFEFDSRIKDDFLSRVGWADAAQSAIGDDWALRRFFRLTRNGETAILMQSVPDDDPRATRGHKLGDFIIIAKYLRALGLRAPEVYAEDIANGLMIVEDFSDLSLHEVFQANDAKLEAYYLKATDILIELYHKTDQNTLDLKNYYDGHIHAARRFLVDYYLPTITKGAADDEMVARYLVVWNDIEKTLPPVAFRFVHADYHPHNLMITDNEIGLIDFQGALWGPAPYDLVNLLEDARRLVPADIKHACKARYLAALPEDQREGFDAWYTVLAAQFHCRVIGQAIKLAGEGKPRLLDYVPVLESHLKQDLQSPILRPLAMFLADSGLDFAA